MALANKQYLVMAWDSDELSDGAMHIITPVKKRVSWCLEKACEGTEDCTDRLVYEIDIYELTIKELSDLCR